MRKKVRQLDERATEGGRYHDDVRSILPEMRRADGIIDIQQFIRTVKPDEYYHLPTSKTG